MERLQRHLSGTCVCFTRRHALIKILHLRCVPPSVLTRMYVRYASAVPGLLRLPVLVSPAADADFFSRALWLFAGRRERDRVPFGVMLVAGAARRSPRLRVRFPFAFAFARNGGGPQCALLGLTLRRPSCGGAWPPPRLAGRPAGWFATG